MKRVFQIIFGMVFSSLALFPLACGKPFTHPSLPKATWTPTGTPTFTLTTTIFFTATETSTVTNNPTNTPADTFTLTNTPTVTNTPTITNTPTVTNTKTATYSITDVATAMAVAPDLNLSSAVTTLNSGLYYFNCVNLGAGGVVTINGAVTIFTKCFNLAAGATFTGLGKGYSTTVGWSGPGYGKPGVMFAINAGVTIGQILFGGGGGHGGVGGTYGMTGCVDMGNATTYCYVPADGGPANDDPNFPVLMGSAGQNNSRMAGLGTAPECTAGGGLLKIVVYDPGGDHLAPATINGTMDMGGSSGCGVLFYHDGGGAGGTLLIEASTLSGNGRISADGGGGDNSGGGSGGGGGGELFPSSGTKPPSPAPFP